MVRTARRRGVWAVVPLWIVSLLLLLILTSFFLPKWRRLSFWRGAVTAAAPATTFAAIIGSLLVSLPPPVFGVWIGVHEGGNHVRSHVDHAEREEEGQVREPNVFRAEKVCQAQSDEFRGGEKARVKLLPNANEEIPLMLVPQPRDRWGWSVMGEVKVKWGGQKVKKELHYSISRQAVGGEKEDGLGKEGRKKETRKRNRVGRCHNTVRRSARNREIWYSPPFLWRN